LHGLSKELKTSFRFCMTVGLKNSRPSLIHGSRTHQVGNSGHKRSNSPHLTARSDGEVECSAWIRAVLTGGVRIKRLRSIRNGIMLPFGGMLLSPACTSNGGKRPLSMCLAPACRLGKDSSSAPINVSTIGQIRPTGSVPFVPWVV
jgi:hypothetical protein